MGAKGAYFFTVKGVFLHQFTPQNWHFCFATAMRRAGLKKTSYSLKHTLAENAAAHLDARDLRQIFGHSRQQTTEAYTDGPNEERLLAAKRNASMVISNCVPILP
jgi:integrase